jgi:predicted helicase
MYDSPLFVDERGSCDQIFPRDGRKNIALCILSGDCQPFSLIASLIVPNLNLYSADATTYFPLKRFSDGEMIDNITDWTLEQFRARYNGSKTSKRTITKSEIFHYVYGLLHDSAYREKYALNLKREFPRIPFYADFWRWADWGKKLMALHIGYETVEPWPLERIDTPDEKSRKAELAPKAMLKGDKENGKYSARQRDTTDRRAIGSVGLPAWEPLRARMDSRPVQGEDAKGPNHSREIQHLPLRRS